MPTKKINTSQQSPYIFKINSEGDGEMWRGDDLIGTGSIDAGVNWALANGAPNVLPEVTSYGYAPIVLNTYYPLRAPYYATGHSSVDIPITNRMSEHFGLKEPGVGKSVGLSVDKTSAANDYNLITNNCSDATREVLEAISGKRMNPIGFTTPGDVRDFAIEEMGGKRKVYVDKNGELQDQVIIPRNKKNANKIDKRVMKWYTRNNLNNDEAFDETAFFYDYADGGNLNNRKFWNSLSPSEKREIMSVAIKRGITNLDEIKSEYNEFAIGGNLYPTGGAKKSAAPNNFYQTHRARWQKFLLDKGLSGQDAFRLSGYFAAQDAFESGYGKSKAAVEGNNFGGMQHNRKNIKYASANDYFEDKWKMMRNRFSRALGAKSLEEYANIINDPRYIGKGYLYCVYDGYTGKGPIDPKKQAAMQKHYTNTMLNIAGQSGFVGRRIPKDEASLIDLPQEQLQLPQSSFMFTPTNPQAFFSGNPTASTASPQVPASEESPEILTPEQMEARERQEGFDALARLSSVMKPSVPNEEDSYSMDFLAPIANMAAYGGNIYSGTNTPTQQMQRGYVYDVLPGLFAKDGVKIRVSSGFRPGAIVHSGGKKTGRPSRHALKQAADIVGDFKEIRRVLDDPNSHVSRWMMANGYGYLDETLATGTTKHWHDHNGDHSHYHIGTDPGPVSRYQTLIGSKLKNIPSQPAFFEEAPTGISPTPIIPQGIVLADNTNMDMFNPFIRYNTVEEQPEQPLVDAAAQAKEAERLERQRGFDNLNTLMSLIGGTSDNSDLGALGMLAGLSNISAEGGNLYPGGGLLGMLPINIPTVLKGTVNAAKRRVYNTITPKDYNIPKAAKEFIGGKNRNLNNTSSANNEEWARYLGVPYEGESQFEPSPYRPQKGKTYDTVLKFKDESKILSDDVLKQMINRQNTTGKNSWLIEGDGSGLGSYTISLGEDDNGKYISYYDDWDINPFKGISSKVNIPFISNIENIVPGSNPFTVYGRRYYTDSDLK